MEKPNLLILGAGGFGRVTAEQAAESGRFGRIAFLDDGASGPEVLGRLADYARFAPEFACGLVAIGNNALRLQWLEHLARAGFALPVLCHDRAWVSPSAQVGAGSILLPGAVVNTNAWVGRGCILNCGAVVDHDCRVEEGCHVCLNAVVKSQSTLPACTKLEACRVFPAP